MLINKKRRYYSLLVLMGLLVIMSISVNAMEPEEVLKEVYQKMNMDGDGYMLEIKAISHKANESNQAGLKVYLHKGKSQMVTFYKPEHLQETRYLVKGHNTWMFQKGLQRPIRVSAQQKLFGDAGIAETAGINYYRDYQVLEMEEKEESYLFELKARDKQMAYQRVSLWIKKDLLQIEKVLLKAANGNPLKELVYKNYRMVNGHQMADIRVNNVLYEQGYWTELQFVNVEKIQLLDKAFQPLMMGKFDLFLKGH